MSALAEKNVRALRGRREENRREITVKSSVRGVPEPSQLACLRHMPASDRLIVLMSLQPVPELGTLGIQVLLVMWVAPHL